MKRDERIQLENLSKLVYGSKGKYKKMVEKGEVTDLQETLEDGTVRTYKGIHRFSFKEIKEIMQEIWQEELDRQAKEKEEQETKTAQEALTKLGESNVGPESATNS